MEQEARELIAAYALDALDEPDRARAEALLAESVEARDELRTLSDASTALAASTAGPSPSPELRERILTEARSEPQRVAPLARTPSRSRLVPVLAFAATVAAVVAIGLGLWARSLSTELDDTRAALDHGRAVAAILADSSAQEIGLATGTGRLVVSDSGHAVLVVEGLAPPPTGKTYEAWVIDDGAPAPAGTFTSNGRLDLVAVDGTVGPGSVVAVTVEDTGGATHPTSAPIVASNPV